MTNLTSPISCDQNILRVTKFGAIFLGRHMPVSIGWGGIGLKQKEGDGKTPQGTWRIEKWYYRADHLPSIGAIPIRQNDGWSDDSHATHYNDLIRLPTRENHERLFRRDGLYDLVGVIDYNRHPAYPGKGSAIFLHVWRGPRRTTEGCIAFGLEDLLWIYRHSTHKTRIIVK